jgi:hypothetical protein
MALFDTNVSYKKMASMILNIQWLILSNENNKEFKELLNKSNTIKISIKGIKNAKVHVVDNTIKDYQ